MIVVICLFSLLLVSVIGVSASLVLASCALNLPLGIGALGQCGPMAPLSTAASQEEMDRIIALTDEITALERQVAGLQCRAMPPTPTSQPALVDAPDPSPAVAPVPDPTGESPPEPATEPTTEPIPEPASDDLTQEDFGRGDITVLKGCWALDSDYRVRDEQTGQITVYDQWSLCFDEAGQGVERMRATSGESCVGPLTGKFVEGRLNIIEPANLVCSGGTEIFQRNLDCSLDAEADANCTVRQPKVGTTSTARLRRAMGEN